jgi:prepilin-type N-terminal cleavage/methylation domain-containing protein
MRALRHPVTVRTSAPRSPSLPERRAFTVLELLIVLAIVAIVATFAFPKVNFVQFRVDGGARLVRLTLQNAQRLAVTRQYDVIVSFDPATNRMRTLEDNNNNGVADAGERVSWRALEDDVHFQKPPTGINGAAGDAVIGASLRTIDGMPSIVFRRDGAASSDLEVYLTSGRARSNDFRGITLVQATGRTDWYKYIGNQWKPGNL